MVGVTEGGISGKRRWGEERRGEATGCVSGADPLHSTNPLMIRYRLNRMAGMSVPSLFCTNPSPHSTHN
jgi:hypothetical protein